MAVVPVILCGGSGTRLWPVSRRDFAKQHVPILGGESPFQRTLQRIAATGLVGTPIVITSVGERFLAADQAAKAGVPIEIVLEPERRDTLPAIAVAAELAARRDPEAMALILPSDHLIPDFDAFARTVHAAAAAAAQGDLVTFGLTPTKPATSYGYIRPGALNGSGSRHIEAFEEKPTAERAAALIAEGCLWNSGMFCFQAKAGIKAIETYAPETAKAVARALAQGEDDLGALRIGPAFADAPKISFDYGIMEKTDRAVVVEADFEWSDIGDWREIWEQSAKDESGVALEGEAVALDVRNSYLRSDGRLVCALGVENIAVVDTPDAVLVAPLDRTQEVKDLVGKLAAQGRAEATEPARVHRPWGWYQTVDQGERFRVKRIQVAPGKQLSLQKHHHRAEHWVVVRGTAEVTRDNELLMVRENESVYLPLGCVHRLANPGKIPVEIIEVQTGAYLEEDDIVRIQDDFGRH
ncbi:mannose-1-phosphate guanylyltransferase/mannose-6-phosphate isomerase [Ferruginivarius sediminum]|uniref:mannose-1-phosphate guanylyltransferase n=1 Tax=Ferruginivarius sediminum TaxID=2661937 RepID=A0A369TAG7_9PROT|nr:mannose-1-phosphate guanylyltransferase/mannose-6-phosphate isomerase [Ferruginivarius sediminum]RDD62280.1 mannose-1-phosphate guanylyltransferase/mannose-6-phosphate isomerase [Ferruginivarius sediminum]